MQQIAVRRIRRSLCFLLAALSLLALILPSETPLRTTSGETSPQTGALEGRVIAVDAGHGGYDGGARAPNGRWEKAYNLDVAQYLQAELQAMGATVVMTREGDYALCDARPPIRKKRQDMERRAALVLGAGAEMLISIHMNEYRDARQSGPQAFYRADCPAGAELAKQAQAALVESLQPARRRAASVGDFYILSLGIPSVLVECGFLSNPAEEALLRTPAYCARVASAIAGGVLAFCQSTPAETPAPREER